MRKQQFIDLANKYAEGKSTEKETITVENFFEALQKSETELPDEILDKKRDTILNVVKKATLKPEKNIRKNWQIMYKLAAILVVMLGLSYTYNLVAKKNTLIKYASLKGEKKEIKLNDGSIVVLNANSSISVPEKFGNKREVILKGEAYFKVSRNPEKPFVVTTKDITVKVLGTSFDINAYEKKNTKVSVLTGKVEVSSPDGKKVILTKNDQANYKAYSGFVLTRKNSDDEIAWVDNVIVLNNHTLAQTASLLENNYNISISFEDKDIEQYTITGKFKEENYETVLQSIAVLKNVEVKYITKKQIIIRRK